MVWLARWLHVAGQQLTARGQSPWMTRKLKLRHGKVKVAIAREQDGRVGSSASSRSSKDLDEAIQKEADKTRRKAKVLPSLSTLKRVDLLRVAKQFEITLPDPEHMTVEQLRAFLYKEDEKLSRDKDTGKTKVTFGKYQKLNLTFEELRKKDHTYCEWILQESKHTNKNMDDFRSYLLEMGTLKSDGASDQAHTEKSHRQRPSSESEVPTDSSSEEPNQPTEGTRSRKRGARSRPAASSASARSRSMSWEDLRDASPMDYSHAIGACLNHLMSRMEAHPQATRMTAQVAHMVREQFQILSLEADERGVPSEMRGWMNKDPKVSQVLELRGRF